MVGYKKIKCLKSSVFILFFRAIFADIIISEAEFPNILISAILPSLSVNTLHNPFIPSIREIMILPPVHKIISSHSYLVSEQEIKFLFITMETLIAILDSE